MLFHKTWTALQKDCGYQSGSKKVCREGWFLFGFIPLYIRENPRYPS